MISVHRKSQFKMLGDFISEVLGEMIVVPLFNTIVAVVWSVVRNSTLLALYPIMLFTGLLRLWLRERSRHSLSHLWREHGPAGLHRFGWQEAALDVESVCATVLITLAGAGICLVAYAILSQWFL
ncbi:hypothetical protein ACVWYF_000239 [Hymenobacter sp. UYAg731]